MSRSHEHIRRFVSALIETSSHCSFREQGVVWLHWSYPGSSKSIAAAVDSLIFFEMERSGSFWYSRSSFGTYEQNGLSDKKFRHWYPCYHPPLADISHRIHIQYVDMWRRCNRQHYNDQIDNIERHILPNFSLLFWERKTRLWLTSILSKIYLEYLPAFDPPAGFTAVLTSSRNWIELFQSSDHVEQTSTRWNQIYQIRKLKFLEKYLDSIWKNINSGNW